MFSAVDTIQRYTFKSKKCNVQEVNNHKGMMSLFTKVELSEQLQAIRASNDYIIGFFTETSALVFLGFAYMSFLDMFNVISINRKLRRFWGFL